MYQGGWMPAPGGPQEAYPMYNMAGPGAPPPPQDDQSSDGVNICLFL